MIPTRNTIPYAATPRVTWVLIGLCAATYLYGWTLDARETEAFLARYALRPRILWTTFDPLPLLTSMFLHGGLLHIASNLWVLWVFGPALEDRLGPVRYLVLYLAAGLAAGLAHAVFNLGSDVPTLGASGAIAGIIAAYARRFPYAWVNVLQPIMIVPVFFTMPALLFAGLWFVSQIMQGLGAMALPGAAAIAWWAHVGGFLAGWWLIRRLAPPADPAVEAGAAARSALWPWQWWWRWWTWWWPRR